MEGLSDIGVIREVLARHGFQFSKALGQNFLINPSVCPRMAQMSGADENTGVLEIGPGLGVLTQQLCGHAKKVVALEIDERLLPVLSETLGEHRNLEIMHADVLKTDLRALLAEQFPDMPVVVCANLPYYITSPIIMNLLEQKLPVQAITVMVQKEAANRICAAPGTRECGAVSLAVRYYSEPQTLFTVSRGSFMPSPKVDSAVIRMDVRERPAVDALPEHFFPVVKAAFSMRRKTLENALSGGLRRSKQECASILQQAGVPAGARAEQLTLAQFGALANAYAQSIQS